MTNHENSLTEPVEWPDAEAAAAQARLGHGRLGFGALDALAEWSAGVQAQCPAAPFVRPRLIVFAGDHGIAEAGVSNLPPSYAADQVSAIRNGEAAVNRIANLARVGVVAVHPAAESAVQIEPVSGRIDTVDAMDQTQVKAAVELGAAIADAEIDSGADLLLLGDVGRASTTSAAVLVSVLTNSEPLKCIGRGSGIDDDTWMRKMAAVRDARLRAWRYRHEPAELIRVIGGADIAAMTGFLHRAAVRRTPVLLDGLVGAAVALLVQRIDPVATHWFKAALSSTDAGQTLAIKRLGLTPILELDLPTSAGLGTLLAFGPLQSAVSLR